MQDTRPLIALALSLSLLACTLTQAPAITGSLINPATPAQPATLPRLATTSATIPACEVRTGYPDGSLHMRECPGPDCPVLAYLHEGDPLIVLGPAAGGWLHVQSGDMQGYVKAKYTDCEDPP